MRFFFCGSLLGAALLTAAPAAQAQQPVPVPALSDDSVRVMATLVQSSVRQLRGIYFEPNDARAAQLIDAALVEIPGLNQRLSRYTASLPREQQLLLAQRLRQQPWQIELQTLMRSPQVRGFDARAAKHPELKVAAERLHASGFAGTAKVAPPAPAAAEPVGTIVFAPAKVRTAPPAGAVTAPKAPGRPQPTTAPPAPAPAAAAAARHTVQKGDTLFGICRQYGVTPAQLRTWNSKQNDAVRIGEILVLSAPQ
ncbi:LysM peptidoglycan-binding domain-containing protein [Hymenobacter algoricola]|uniref:LysM domain-containing protein n=1 Tax=Hymenobacter algoricola TaxID=486267 RepID=A0ABP7NUY9_9BACT